MNHLRQGLAEANAWNLAFFGGDADFLRSAQGCVRYILAFASIKIRYLNTLPWLLVRLRDPGIKAECQRQWNLVPPQQHHPLTRTFMDPTHPSGLAALVDEVDDLGVCPARLEWELVKLDKIPLDDSVGEAPPMHPRNVCPIIQPLRLLPGMLRLAA